MTTTTDNDTVSPEEQARFQLLGELLQGGTTLGDLADMQPEHYEAMYTTAHQLYSAGRYEDAEKLFTFLCIRNPREQRFVFGLGACQQVQGKWQDALTLYACLVPRDIENPVPPFHICECLVGLGQVAEAVDVLQDLVHRMPKPEHAELKKRASAMLTLLQMQLAKAPQ
jgi:type III secretion system low calcium response chaperone LcrH/SycD